MCMGYVTLVGGILLGTLDLLTLVLRCLRPSLLGLFDSDGLGALVPGIAYVGCTPVLIISGSLNNPDHTWISGVGISLVVVGVLRFSITVVRLWLLARSPPSNSTTTAPVQPDEEQKDDITSPVSLYETHGPILPTVGLSPRVARMRDQSQYDDGNDSPSSPLPSLPHAELHKPDLISQEWVSGGRTTDTSAPASNTQPTQPDDHQIVPCTTAQLPRAVLAPVPEPHTRKELRSTQLNASHSVSPSNNERLSASQRHNMMIQVDGLGELELSSDSESEWGEDVFVGSSAPTDQLINFSTTTRTTNTSTKDAPMIRKRSTLSRDERTQLKEARAIKRHLSQRGQAKPLGSRSSYHRSTQPTCQGLDQVHEEREEHKEQDLGSASLPYSP